MRKKNVLIFPAGTEIGLEIYSALKHCKEVSVFGAGQDVSNHAEFMLPEYHILPGINEIGWLSSLLALVQKLDIDYIFPAYDDVIVALSQARDRIPAAIISSSAVTCSVTRSKSATYRTLSGKVRVPHVYESLDAVDIYPVLVKPDRGQGSQNVFCVNTPDELNIAISKACDPIICEYLPGEEFTVDCFSDRDQGLLFAGARIRRRIRSGISVNTQTVKLPEAWDIAKIIGETFELRGAWFFQLKRASDGELALLEIAPRIAGSMATHRVLGVNFPLLSIFENDRIPFKIVPALTEIELDRALSNRYRHTVNFSTMYIDLDDTLIFNNTVNLLAMSLIFQCINAGKRVILITKHAGDLTRTLARFRLSGLFDEILHIPAGTLKSDYIKEKDSILIDDSYSERMDVANRCGIPTFDCSMMELLIQ